MRILPILFSSALLAPLAFAQAGGDVVVKKDGSRIRGVEVAEFLLTGVRGKRGSDDFEVPAHQVLAIEWGGEPDAFGAGRAALERGSFADAAQLFGEAKRQSTRPIVQVDAEFFMVKAAVAAIGADKSAAANAASSAQTWLSANANNWHTPEMMLLAGRAQRLAGTAGTAATTLKELDDRAAREAWGPVWSARAKLELALTLLADGKTSEARTTFQAASAAADNALLAPSGDDADLKKLKTTARVGEGETYLGDKDFGKAENFFRTLANSNQPELVSAGRAGEGEAIFLNAVASNHPENLRRAQIALAMASVKDSTSGEASAKADYYLGRCLLALGTEREGETFKQRANAYFQLVVDNYPDSPWAAAAKQAMQ